METTNVSWVDTTSIRATYSFVGSSVHSFIFRTFSASCHTSVVHPQFNSINSFANIKTRSSTRWNRMKTQTISINLWQISQTFTAKHTESPCPADSSFLWSISMYGFDSLLLPKDICTDMSGSSLNSETSHEEITNYKSHVDSTGLPGCVRARCR